MKTDTKQTVLTKSERRKLGAALQTWERRRAIFQTAHAALNAAILDCDPADEKRIARMLKTTKNLVALAENIVANTTL